MNFIVDTLGSADISEPIKYIRADEFGSTQNDAWELEDVQPPSFVQKILNHIQNMTPEELNEKPTKKKTKPLQTKNMEIDDEIPKDSGIKAKTDKIDKILKQSVITPNFERLESIPQFLKTSKELKRERRREREKTKGHKWFGLPAPEITEEVKHDLEVLQMRSVLDPKHFYKKNDLKVLPKYFQIGKVMDSPIDYYNNRCTRKERKKTLVQELLADAEFKKYNKRRYRQILEEKQKTHYKAYRQAKKLKKRKK